jgi:ATP-dependent Lhr-like helicase
VVPRPAGLRSATGADPRTAGSVRVLYVSPLKALTYDIERNLRAPLTGIGLAAARSARAAADLGREPDRRHAVRGSARDRRHPPDILITTPESCT